jgi:transcription elongation factor GreA
MLSALSTLSLKEVVPIDNSSSVCVAFLVFVAIQISFLLGRVEQLEGAINEAIIKDNDGSNKAQIGSKVKILFNESEEVYTITGPTEADILKNKISYQSPLGQKLVGKNEGDAFSYEMNGRKINVKVLEVI